MFYFSFGDKQALFCFFLPPYITRWPRGTFTKPCTQFVHLCFTLYKCPSSQKSVLLCVPAAEYSSQTLQTLMLLYFEPWKIDLFLEARLQGRFVSPQKVLLLLVSIQQCNVKTWRLQQTDTDVRLPGTGTRTWGGGGGAELIIGSFIGDWCFG